MDHGEAMCDYIGQIVNFDISNLRGFYVTCAGFYIASILRMLALGKAMEKPRFRKKVTG